MESQSAGFPPFPHSLEIPSGFPHSHGHGYDEISIEKQRQSPAANQKLSHQLRKGLVTDVPGPICKACPGTLSPLGRVFAVAVALVVVFGAAGYELASPGSVLNPLRLYRRDEGIPVAMETFEDRSAVRERNDDFTETQNSFWRNGRLSGPIRLPFPKAQRMRVH